MSEPIAGNPSPPPGSTPFGVPMDTLSVIQSQRSGADDNVEIEVEEPGTPGASTEGSPAAPDFEGRFRELEARLAETARNNAVLEERLRNTQAWGQTRNQEAGFAQQVIEAGRQERERLAWEEQQRRNLAPPEWTAEEVDALAVGDPDVLRRKMQEHARWGAHTALTEIAPYISDLGRIAQQVPVVNEIQAAIVHGLQRQSVGEAVRAVLARGELDQETVNNLLPRVYEMFNTQGPTAAVKLSLQPDSIAAGIELIHRYQTGGVAPVKVKPKAPRTLGAGSSGGTSKITVPREVSEEIRRWEEKHPGLRFTPDEVRSFAGGK